MRIGKGLPWIASFAVHAVAAVIAASLLSVTPVAPQRPLRVDVQLVSRASAAARAPAVTGTAIPRGTATPAEAHSPAVAGAQPGGEGSTRSTVPPGPATGVLPYEGQGQAARTVSALPSTQDVLSDLAAAAPGSDTGSAVAPVQGERFSWEGPPRELIRSRKPQFPLILGAAGQEVEVVARITVAPSGVVTRVEITRSSGYIEVDDSVEAALRDDLYSRVNGRSDSVGTRKYRFRLEKMD
jgi:TonB family protein